MIVKNTNAKYLDGLMTYINANLENNELVQTFNNIPYHVHFKNGVYDLKLNEFRQRTKEDYATFCLDYDYIKIPIKECKKEVYEIIKQICNDNDEDTEFLLDWLGYTLTGETKEHKFLYCVGHSASNGKSTIAKIFRDVFSVYSYEAMNRTFDSTYGKAHKQINDMKHKRFVFVEELKRANIDTDLLKRSY